MKQKGFTQVYILIALIVLGAVGGAYYLGTTKSSIPRVQDQVIVSQAPQPIITSKPILTPVTTSRPTDSTKATDNTEQAEELKTETISYKPDSSWSTYTDKVAKFTIQYPPEHKVSDASKEGQEVYIWSCGFNDPNRGKICSGGFSLRIYNDYDQGSRREWVSKKFAPYKPYYLNWIIDGKKALVMIEGNPGGSSSMLVAIPNGSQMVVYSKGFVSWDPDTNKLPDLTYQKNILSTFRFD